jgi:hypothetical protein
MVSAHSAVGTVGHVVLCRVGKIPGNNAAPDLVHVAVARNDRNLEPAQILDKLSANLHRSQQRPVIEKMVLAPLRGRLAPWAPERQKHVEQCQMIAFKAGKLGPRALRGLLFLTRL